MLMFTRRHFLHTSLLLGVGTLLTQTSAGAYTLRATDTPWLVSGADILVPDWWLTRNLGIELVSGLQLAQQACRWFGQEFSLPLSVSPPHWPGRYVRLADLKQQLGLDTATVGLSLEIPTAQVISLQFGVEQLILELDRPTPWQWHQQGTLGRLTLIARFPDLPALPRASLLKNLTLTGHQLELELPQGRAINVRMEARRLILDFSIPINSRLYEQLWQPGLTYQQWDFYTPSAQRAHVLFLDQSYTWQLVQTNTKKTLTDFARSAGAIAAINAGFFNLATGYPLGAIRQDGRWTAGPILGRGAVAWNRDQVQFDRLTWQGTLAINQLQLGLVGWNTAYAQAGISVYTPDWGSHYSALQDSEIAVVVQANQSQKPLRLSRGQPVVIPVDGYLLVGRSQGQALLLQQFVTVISPVLTLGLMPPDWQNLPYILGAGPLLLKDGNRVLDADLEKFQPDVKDGLAQRTAVARHRDGRLVWVMTEGRQATARGLTLADLTLLLQRLDCVDAVNLDGGTSSGLYLGGTLRNQVNGSERLLSSALVLSRPD